MIPNPAIDDLAREIRERSDEVPSGWQGPYILFLGEGCAHAAGAPSRAAIARQALRTFAEDPGPDEPDVHVFARFAKHAERISPAQLARMLRGLYAQVPVPSFYQYLAELIRERYFPIIFTMNFDTLLEQALENAGVRNVEYRITTFDSRRRSRGPETEQRPLTHLIKLHGDIAQDVAQFTTDQVQEALNASRHWIKSDLRGDLIMVGHMLSDDPIDRWLAYTPDRELWWVCERPPDDPRKVASWTTRPVREIVGELGRPQVFFPQLALRLLRSTDTETAPIPAPAPSLPEYAPMEPETARTVPLSNTLRNEILRNQSVLFSLEQDSAAGERPAQVQAQIEYQKRQISHLEDRIRTLPDVRPEIMQAVERIRDRIRDNGPARLNPVDLGKMVGFVDLHLNSLKEELEKESPNQIMVSGYLGATLTLADRLLTEYGPSVVDPQDVKRLASLAPTAAAKVVL